MSRGISGTLLSHFDSDHIVSVVAVKLSFDSGTQRYHTGVGDLTYLSEVYIGVGTLIGIESILEDQGIKMKGIQISLQGVDTTVVDLTNNEDVQGRSAVLYLIAYNYETADVIDGFEIFSGTMDTFEISRGVNATMTLAIESVMSQFDLPSIRRMTDEDHQSRFPGDTFFDLMVKINESEINWGSNTDSNRHSGSYDRDYDRRWY